MPPALALARLLRPEGMPPPSEAPDAATVERWVARRLAESRCPRPGPGADEDDPHVGLFWLLTMAARTYRRSLEPLPSVDPAVRARFVEALGQRPARDAEHGQLHIDPDSSLRRAQMIAERLALDPGPVVAVGDDDAVSVALAALGIRELCALDIDARVLAHVRRSAERLGARVETHRVDVLGAPVPPELRRRFAVAVTDPFRSLDDTLGFCTFAMACLRRSAPSHLVWVDHPDWNFEHDLVLESLERLGLRRVATYRELHAYPLSDEIIQPDELATALDLDPAWLREVTSHTRAWSHAHVLRMDATA